MKEGLLSQFLLAREPMDGAEGSVTEGGSRRMPSMKHEGSRLIAGGAKDHEIGRNALESIGMKHRYLTWHLQPPDRRRSA